MTWKLGPDIHGSQRMNPPDFSDPQTSPPMSPCALNLWFWKKCFQNYWTDWQEVLFRHSCSPMIKIIVMTLKWCDFSSINIKWSEFGQLLLSVGLLAVGCCAHICTETCLHHSIPDQAVVLCLRTVFWADGAQDSNTAAEKSFLKCWQCENDLRENFA